MSKSKKQKMLFGTIAAMLVAATMTTQSAQAAKVNYDVTETSIFTPTYGKALPPIGYVNFCSRNANECRSLGGTTKKVVLTEQNWKIMHEVNNYSNKTVKPVTDSELYNSPEYWTYPQQNAGDCEDYVLQKKRYLEGLGFPAETLLITVVLDTKGLGHAVLTVRTDRGDFILDNMRNDIRNWRNTGYTYIKRQSQHNPQIWTALTNRGTTVSRTTVAGQK